MTKTIQVKSGHTMFIKSIDRSELPAHLAYTQDFTHFYVVKNWDDNGVTFLYLGKGQPAAPGQIVAWYRKTGAMWTSFGKNFKAAIEGAQADGWMYA
jgi:hypothetical protein